jgi:SAM-dependent methyltransferase
LPSIYDNAPAFDRLFPSDPRELAFWLDRLGAPRGRVLELACGSGRLAIPMALAGHSVVGLDSSESMLAEARRKAAAAGARVEWRLGDIRRSPVHSPGESYSTVLLLGNSLAHLETVDDLVSCFRAARAALTGDGRFFIDVFVPDPRFLAMSAYVEMPFSEYFDPGTVDPISAEPVRLLSTGAYDHARQLWRAKVVRALADGGREAVADLTLRMTYPQELEGLLRWQGFEIVERCGDYDGGPFDARPEHQLLVCRPSGMAVEGGAQ